MALLLHDMLQTIKKLRDEVPAFDPTDGGNKEKIEYFHTQIHSLVLTIQHDIGFDSYEQTLKFIDLELGMARL